jgi:hypothetical protein
MSSNAVIVKNLVDTVFSHRTMLLWVIFLIGIIADIYTHQFLQGQINRSCDTYLDELREELEEKCGVSVSLATVWRALRRSGHTMKKVFPHQTL